MVRAEGLEPSRPLAVCGFSYHFGFRRPADGEFVVWTIPSPFLCERFRCCPSSLYTFPEVLRAWLGIAIQVSPTLSSSTPPVSRRALKFLKSAVSADFTTPA